MRVLAALNPCQQLIFRLLNVSLPSGCYLQLLQMSSSFMCLLVIHIFTFYKLSIQIFGYFINWVDFLNISWNTCSYIMDTISSKLFANIICNIYPVLLWLAFVCLLTLSFDGKLFSILMRLIIVFLMIHAFCVLRNLWLTHYHTILSLFSSRSFIV